MFLAFILRNRSFMQKRASCGACVACFGCLAVLVSFGRTGGGAGEK